MTEIEILSEGVAKAQKEYNDAYSANATLAAEVTVALNNMHSAVRSKTQAEAAPSCLDYAKSLLTKSRSMEAILTAGKRFDDSLARLVEALKSAE